AAQGRADAVARNENVSTAAAGCTNQSNVARRIQVITDIAVQLPVTAAARRQIPAVVAGRKVARRTSFKVVAEQGLGAGRPTPQESGAYTGDNRRKDKT